MKWIGIAILIGAVAGVGAVLFDVAIGVARDVFLGRVIGTEPPQPAGEGTTIISSIDRRWLLPVVTMLGGFLSGALALWLARETAGGGNDRVIAAYHYEAGNIRNRVPPVKLIASAITIGSGGSAGREGPMAMIGAGFGSIISRIFRLSVSERRLFLLVGMGAGIGAIFRAPLGGAILAAELLYREDIETEAIIPALIASIVAYSVFSSYAGWDPLFSTPDDVVFDRPVQLVYFAIIGLLAGLLGIVFTRSLANVSRVFSRARIPNLTKPAIGGLIVGLIAIFVPQTLGTGYGWAQIAITEDLFRIPFWIVLLLPLLKIVTTCLTVESGASGGVFGPGMVIGAMMGAGFWRLFHNVLPGMPDDPASFTIIGMIAHLGAVAHVPLAVMIMVTEMTRNPSFLAPALIAVGFSTFIVGRRTIFPAQLSTHADSPVHQHLYAFPLLSKLTAQEALQPAAVRFHPAQTVAFAEDVLHDYVLTGAPVIDDDKQLVGVLTSDDIAEIPEAKRSTTHVYTAMNASKTRFDCRVPLDVILDSMASQGLSWIPILEPEGRDEVAGIVTITSILQAYRDALSSSVRRTDELMVGSTLLEVRVNDASPLCNCPVKELNFPEDALLVSYTRAQVVRFPHGNTVFEPGDIVGVVTSRAAEQHIRRYLETEMSAQVVGRESSGEA